MPANDDIRFTSLKLPFPSPPFDLSPLFTRTRNSFAQLFDSVKIRSGIERVTPKFLPLPSRPLFRNRFTAGELASRCPKLPPLCWASLSLTRSDSESRKEDRELPIGKSSLLCSASLSLTRPDDSTQSGLERRETTASAPPPQQHKGHSASRHDEERVLISEVLVRNKDGDELERKDLEMEALAALKACRPNSALTVREVQEDVHRVIGSGYFCSCMPVAVDTRDGIRLVFQVKIQLCSSLLPFQSPIQ